MCEQDSDKSPGYRVQSSPVGDVRVFGLNSEGNWRATGGFKEGCDVIRMDSVGNGQERGNTGSRDKLGEDG